MFATEKNHFYVRIKGEYLKPGQPVKLLEGTSLHEIKSTGTDIEKLSVYINDMCPDEKCLLVYSTCASLGYKDPILLRSGRIALDFARNGWKVFYLPFNEPDQIFFDEGLTQIPPKFKHQIINLLLQRTGSHNIFYNTSFPDINSIGFMDLARNQGWKTVFELRDDMEEMNRMGISKWYDPQIEKYIADRADYLVAVSWRLKNRLSAMTGGKDVILNPNAAPGDLISMCSELRTEQVRAEREKSRKIGCISSLHAKWFDWPTLIEAARKRSDIQFEIIGTGFPMGLKLPPNIIYLGPKTHSECIPIVRSWKAGIIPFMPSRMTWGVSPNKAYEYLAMGLKIISSPMGRMHDFPFTALYRSPEEFLEALDGVFTPLTEADMQVIEDFLGHNAWECRLNELRTALRVDQ